MSAHVIDTRDVAFPVSLHQWVDTGPRLNVKVEKNSRGVNYEITVTGAKTVDEALALVREATTKLKSEFAE